MAMGLKRRRLMEEKKEEEEKGISGLPGELMSDILSRFPVRDVLQCRSVCKGWNRCIRDPEFLNIHHSRQLQRANPDFLLVCSGGGGHKKNGSELFLVENGSPHVLNDDGLHFMKGKKKLFIVGCCNGLVCLSSKINPGLFYVCNPITKEIIRLPKPPDYPMEDYEEIEEICGPASPGFGFDASTNTYKVVRPWIFREQDRGQFKTRVDIYTLGLGGPDPAKKSSPSWRRIQDIPSPLCSGSLDSPAIFLQGALHWDMMNNNMYSSMYQVYNCIGALDVSTENFQAFELPPSLLATEHSLGTLSDFLCIIDESVFHSFVVWTMKKYGVTRSWSRDYVVNKPTLVGPLQGISFHHFRAVPASNGGRKHVVFLPTGKHKGYYDFDTRQFQPIDLKGIPPAQHLDVSPLVATFISPTNPTLGGLTTGSSHGRITRSTAGLVKKKKKKQSNLLT